LRGLASFPASEFRITFLEGELGSVFEVELCCVWLRLV
jgi:hypothetical protein